MSEALALTTESNENTQDKTEFKPSVSWREIKARMLKNPDIASEIKELEPEYEIIQQIVKSRLEQGISQKELAERAGTKQSDISRLESGNSNPSLKVLKKIASGLGKELHVTFK